MTDWITEPETPGWYWVVGEDFSKPTPVEVRIVDVDQLNYGGKRVEVWNPKKIEWELASKIDAFMPIAMPTTDPRIPK